MANNQMTVIQIIHEVWNFDHNIISEMGTRPTYVWCGLAMVRWHCYFEVGLDKGHLSIVYV